MLCEILLAVADGCSSAGAKAFALDTRSKRQWQNPPLSNANAAAFRLACNEFGFSPAQILPHGVPPPCLMCCWPDSIVCCPPLCRKLRDKVHMCRKLSHQLGVP